MTRRPRWQQEDPRFGEESKRYEKPIPSRELLLAKLAEASKPLGFDPLAALLGIRDPERAPGALQAPRCHGARRRVAGEPRERILPGGPPARDRRHRERPPRRLWLPGAGRAQGRRPVPAVPRDAHDVPRRPRGGARHGARRSRPFRGRHRRSARAAHPAGRRALLARGWHRVRDSRQPAHQPACGRAARGHGDGAPRRPRRGRDHRAAEPQPRSRRARSAGAAREWRGGRGDRARDCLARPFQ